MAGLKTDSDAWKRIVLQAMTPPQWLRNDGPHRDIVLSTRVRYMRNLQGHRFPHHAPVHELREILESTKAVLAKRLPFEFLNHTSPAERDYLVACRLVSPDFDWSAPGRGLLLDEERSTSIMINEEDHLRIQALAPGWSLSLALRSASDTLEIVEKNLRLAHTDRLGYLAASAGNSGAGLRYSAMFHLIGLASSRRLPTVLKALQSQGLVTRGLFGEHSRAIGAFAQVSSTASSIPHFVGACDYLIDQETMARRGVPGEELDRKTREAAVFVESRQTLSLADALRVLAWARWSSGEFRAIDLRIPELALLESLGEPRAGRARASLLRQALGPRPTS